MMPTPTPTPTPAPSSQLDAITPLAVMASVDSIDPSRSAPLVAYLARLGPSSRRTMLSAATNLARACGGVDAESFDWRRLDVPCATMLRAWCAMQVEHGRFAPATANLHIHAMRGIARGAWQLGLLTTDEYERIKDLPVLRYARPLRGREVPSEERLALFEVDFGHETYSARNRFVIGLAYLGGLRRSEIAALRIEDLALDPPAVRVHGKGDKVREVPLSYDIVTFATAWLSLRSDTSGALVCRIARDGTPRPEAFVSGETIRQILVTACQRAGVPLCSPHDLRRTYAGDLLDAGVDLVTVARLMGHAAPTTTARYDRRGARAARDAAERLRLHAPGEV